MVWAKSRLRVDGWLGGWVGGGRDPETRFGWWVGVEAISAASRAASLLSWTSNKLDREGEKCTGSEKEDLTLLGWMT